MNSKLNNLLNNQRLLKFLLNYSIFILGGELVLSLIPLLGWGDILPLFRNGGFGLFWNVLTSWVFVYLGILILFRSRYQRSEAWLLSLFIMIFMILLQQIDSVLSYFFITPTESGGLLGLLDSIAGTNSFFPGIIISISMSALAMARIIFSVLLVIYSFKFNQRLLKIISVLMIGQFVFPTILTLLMMLFADEEMYSDPSKTFYDYVSPVLLFLMNGSLIYWFSKELNKSDENINPELDDKINMGLGGFEE